MKSPQIHSSDFPASKAASWLNCGLFSKVNKDAVFEETEVARYGTQTHALGCAEIKKRMNLKDYDEDDVLIEELIKTLDLYDENMKSLAENYAQTVISVFESQKKVATEEPIIVLEQLLEMDFSEGAKGTLDCGIYSDANGGTVTIIDLKTGRSPVMAFDRETNTPNAQLSLYALYFVKAYKDIYPIKNVRLLIVQPVINNTNDYEMNVDDLFKFETDVLLPAVKRAKADNPEANPGKQCKYCAFACKCKKRMEATLGVIDNSKEASELSDDEILSLLPKLDEIGDYIASVKTYATKKAQEGYKWPGFKLVRSKVTRKISNEEQVAKILKENGIEPYGSASLLGITELTRKLGKAKFNELIGPFITIQEGSLVLVSNSDIREEVTIEHKEAE